MCTANPACQLENSQSTRLRESQDFCLNALLCRYDPVKVNQYGISEVEQMIWEVTPPPPTSIYRFQVESSGFSVGFDPPPPSDDLSSFTASILSKHPRFHALTQGLWARV